MTSVKMVLVIEHGVLGYIVREISDELAIVRWYLDGIGYESTLEENIEYVVKSIGEICV